MSLTHPDAPAIVKSSAHPASTGQVDGPGTK
jgi:hypothetical protein